METLVRRTFLALALVPQGLLGLAYASPIWYAPAK
jgi:hypothetical protein